MLFIYGLACLAVSLKEEIESDEKPQNYQTYTNIIPTINDPNNITLFYGDSPSYLIEQIERLFIEDKESNKFEIVQILNRLNKPKKQWRIISFLKLQPNNFNELKVLLENEESLINRDRIIYWLEIKANKKIPAPPYSDEEN